MKREALSGLTGSSAWSTVGRLMKAPRESHRARRRASSGRRSSPPGARPVLSLLRFLIVACALQLSGTAHLLLDLVGGSAVACIDTCDCADESGADEHGCPPDCPDCSCPHGRLPSLPPEVALA